MLIGLASSRLIIPERLTATDQFGLIKQILQEKLAEPEIQAALSVYAEDSHYLDIFRSPVPKTQECNAREFLSNLFESRGSSLEQFETRLVSALNASDLVNLTNSELGVEVLVINGDFIQLQTSGVQTLIISYAKQQIKNNVKSKLIQLALNTLVKTQVYALSDELERYLSEIQISVDAVNEILSQYGFQRGFISNILDTLLDALLNTVIQQIRLQIYKVIYPYYNLVIAAFDDVIATLLLFYTTSQPDGVLAQTVSSALNLVVVKAVTVIGGVQYNITVIFDKIFGNTTIDTDDRKRRSIEETTIAEDNEQSGLDVVLKPINLVAKAIVAQSLTDLYPVVGQIVLKPVKSLLYDVIDLIIRCSTC